MKRPLLRFCAAGPCFDFLLCSNVEDTGDNVRQHVFVRAFVLHAAVVGLMFARDLLLTVQEGE